MLTSRILMQRKWLHVVWILQGTEKLKTDEMQIWSNLLNILFWVLWHYCEKLKCAILDANVLQVNTRLTFGGKGLSAMLLSAYSFKFSMSELWLVSFLFFLMWTVSMMQIFLYYLLCNKEKTFKNHCLYPYICKVFFAF